MDLGTAATFALAFFLFAASPGPDNITILSKTVNDGPAHGVAYGCGVVASIGCFVVLAAVGLDAVAGAVGEHIRFVRYLGAAYLVYTGIAMWRAPVAVAPRRLRGGLLRLFGLGFLLNVSNPKMPVFYLALLPGVLGTHPLTAADTLVLLAVILAVEGLVIGGHVALALRARSALARPRRLRALNRGAGALMVGAGALVTAR
ncbi:LysE family translocator [Lichenibacterium dinghuense]|uniref:LysE family translocator n=1 Tax=Lichenibacterium dinghuense TaxID=2895977 RepID=UPI001F1A340A|nr:LysE family translocator [Lichenibacterium sp. 6Y81]